MKGSGREVERKKACHPAPQLRSFPGSGPPSHPQKSVLCAFKYQWGHNRTHRRTNGLRGEAQGEQAQRPATRRVAKRPRPLPSLEGTLESAGTPICAAAPCRSRARRRNLKKKGGEESWHALRFLFALPPRVLAEMTALTPLACRCGSNRRPERAGKGTGGRQRAALGGARPPTWQPGRRGRLSTNAHAFCALTLGPTLPQPHSPRSGLSTTG